MLAVQDKANDPKYFDTLKDIAKGGLIVQSSTGTMMERVSSGENLIGYNILGSYAETRAKNDPSLGIAYPTDYALVLSRVAFISKKAKNRNAAKLWMDYMLSQKGQDIIANQADLASVRDDIPGDNDVDGMTRSWAPRSSRSRSTKRCWTTWSRTSAWNSSSSGAPRPANKPAAAGARAPSRQRLTRVGRRPAALPRRHARPPAARPAYPEHRISPCSHCAENGSPCRAAWWC